MAHSATLPMTISPGKCIFRSNPVAVPSNCDRAKAFIFYYAANGGGSIKIGRVAMYEDI